MANGSCEMEQLYDAANLEAACEVRDPVPFQNSSSIKACVAGGSAISQRRRRVGVASLGQCQFAQQSVVPLVSRLRRRRGGNGVPTSPASRPTVRSQIPVGGKPKVSARIRCGVKGSKLEMVLACAHRPAHGC